MHLFFCINVSTMRPVKSLTLDLTSSSEIPHTGGRSPVAAIHSMDAEIEYQRRKAAEYAASGKPIVWDYDQILEYAEGNLAGVFSQRPPQDGSPAPDWKLIDGYRRRVRLPARDYLLCSRITHMDAIPGKFVPSTMVTEYDVMPNHILSEGGELSWALQLESGQCDLVLISYLGVDFANKGDRVYRLLNTSVTFLDSAHEGDTLRYEIKATEYAFRPDGSVHMFFFEYNCYVGDRLVVEMRDGCAGFFTDQELAHGKGVGKQLPKPCPRRGGGVKLELGPRDMLKLAQTGSGWGCVGKPDVRGKLCARKFLMLDRVSIDTAGGSKGLGYIVAEKCICPDDWYFPCHFVGDPVLAGSLVSEGAMQLLKLFAVASGMTGSAPSFVPTPGATGHVRCRGQVSPHDGTVVYLVDVINSGRDVEGRYFIEANCDILDIDDKDEPFDPRRMQEYYHGNPNKRIVVDLRGISMTVLEPLATAPGRSPALLQPPTQWTERGPDGKLMLTSAEDVRDPTQLVCDWHPLVQGWSPQDLPSFSPSEFPPRAFEFLPFAGDPRDADHAPGKLPLTWLNMCEFTCGNISSCHGPNFSKFDDSNTSRMPGWDLQLVTRVVSIDNTRPRAKHPEWPVDVLLDPSHGSIVAEFDCHADAWFLRESPASGIPVCILMELGLQSSGTLTSWVHAPQTLRKKDLLFRNLDATARLHRIVDPSGCRIVNKTKCLGYTMLGNTGIHKFEFALYLQPVGQAEEPAPFYTGTTSFGWFPPEVFDNPVGLDEGKRLAPWHVGHKDHVLVPLPLEATQRGERLRLLGEAVGSPAGGRHDRGYVWATRVVPTDAWFYSCHFWRDSVQPGSLGIESMHEALEAWATSQGIEGPHTLVVGTTKWKYRGQLTPKNRVMAVELHIVGVQADGTVTAEGSFYVDGMRMYEACDLRIRGTIDARRVAVAHDPLRMAAALADLSQPVVLPDGATAHPLQPRDLGDKRFGEIFGVEFPMMTGALAKGVASVELVVAGAKAGVLSSYGAGGLPLDTVRDGIRQIRAQLGSLPYCVNLIHSPDTPNIEEGCTRILLEEGVTVVEASAFMRLTKNLVHYVVRGIEEGTDGQVVERNKLIFKLSRLEILQHAVCPPPAEMLRELVADGLVTSRQAELAAAMPLATAVTVEADSGGHTDRRPLVVLLPLVLSETRRLLRATQGCRGVLVGAAGGIGAPEAMDAAFQLHAAYVVIGTVAQATAEAGTSTRVKKQLSEASYADTAFAPAADMFSLGVKLQVLKTPFVGRGNWLWSIYQKYDSVEDLTPRELQKLVKILGASVEETWKQTRAYYIDRLHAPGAIKEAERDGKLKLDLICRSYLSRTSGYAQRGEPRPMDYQIWCGPAIGSFNQWVKGSPLSQGTPSLAAVCTGMLNGACFLRRLGEIWRSLPPATRDAIDTPVLL